jgi:hypothetical protein
MKPNFHRGIILDASKEGWDSGAATFGTVIYDQDDRKYYLFYTGASDVRWTEASIGLATSQDGLNFRRNDLNPIVNSKDFGLKEALTPVVFRVKNNYFMVFAGKTPRNGRKIYIAYSDDLVGPWRFIKQLIKPQYPWEGNSIDLGPSAARLSENEVLIYYSNVSNKLLRSLLFGPRYWFRTLGILKLKINSPTDIEAYRFDGNPLKHLNGSKGSWNESLFCPGYFRVESLHYLLPAASTYSIGFPYKQYIGLVKDSSPYFLNPTRTRILIDGPREKEKIIPGIRSEIALDTPCPIIRNGELWLYYGAMDRANGVWKTALSIFPLEYIL